MSTCRVCEMEEEEIDDLPVSRVRELSICWFDGSLGNGDRQELAILLENDLQALSAFREELEFEMLMRQFFAERTCFCPSHAVPSWTGRMKYAAGLIRQLLRRLVPE